MITRDTYTARRYGNSGRSMSVSASRDGTDQKVRLNISTATSGHILAIVDKEELTDVCDLFHAIVEDWE